MSKITDKYRVCFVYSALAFTTLAVFWQVSSFEFINYDDDKYVSKNEHIISGLTVDNIRWAFTQPHYFMWHPITTLSNMMDCELFGLNPGRHHLTNLLFHIANALLLFGIFKKMTGRIWPSAFVAALFAVHPLNVESVAWISERKNVLSTFFWILTIAVYIRYAKSQQISNYLLVIFVFSLALMSKPMTVTLPFVLLLLDYWPLNRAGIDATGKIWRHLICEKIPFFIFSAAVCVITVIVQKSGNVLKLNEYLPFSVRLSNALVSYFLYIGKMIYPLHLAIFYPHPGYSLSVWQPVVSLLALAAVSIAVIYFARRHPYLPAGWFWFLGTLIPVIGLVQAGDQSMADRYAYVPLVGLFIIIAWGIDDLLTGWKYRRIILSLSAIALIAVLSVCTCLQTSYWQNSMSLFEHNLKLNNRSIKIHYHLAMALSEKGKSSEAVAHLEKAVEINNNWFSPINSLAWFLATRKNAEFYNPDKAVQLAQRACELTGYQDPAILDTLAVAYASQNRFSEALVTAEKALKIAKSEGDKQLTVLFQQRLDLFKMNQPYVETNPE